MTRFITATFALMFLGFYQLSGGSDFTPGWYIDESRDTARADAGIAAQPEVSRADTAPALTSLAVGAAQAATATKEQMEPTPAVATPAQAAAAIDVPMALRDGPAPVVPLVQAVAQGTGADAPFKAPRPRLRSTDEMPTDGADGAHSVGGAFTDVRTVTSSRVNMRSGPGTQYSVLMKLQRGDEVAVLSREGSWLKLRTVETGRVGWMADFLIAAR